MVASSNLLPGKTFNKYFPQDEGDFKIIFTQEKNGFSLACLNYQEAIVASMSITDLSERPEAVEKYSASSRIISGYPVIDNGTQGTSVLVENRLQVHIRSKVDDFTDAHRASVLENFEFSELARAA